MHVPSFCSVQPLINVVRCCTHLPCHTLFSANVFNRARVTRLFLIAHVSQASLYGQRAEARCIATVNAAGGATKQWSLPSCRTFHSVVEEFFNMKVR